MPDTRIPEEGRNWVVETLVGEGDDLKEIAIGVGDTPTSDSDTELDNEVFATAFDGGNASITNHDGESIRFTITFTGGTEVDPDDEIIEIGVFSESDQLIYREVRDEPIDLDPGQSITVEFLIELENI